MLQVEQLLCRESLTLLAAGATPARGAEHLSPPRPTQTISGQQNTQEKSKTKNKRRTRTGLDSDSDQHQENNLKIRIAGRSSPTASAELCKSRPLLAELPPAFEALSEAKRCKKFKQTFALFLRVVLMLILFSLLGQHPLDLR